MEMLLKITKIKKIKVINKKKIRISIQIAINQVDFYNNFFNNLTNETQQMQFNYYL